jgi:anti-sigma B factor antagonist
VKQANEVLSGGHTKLVLDLGGVDFISSGGLLALQTIAVRAVSHDGRAVLACVGEPVMKILGTTGLDKKLDIFPDVASAKACFE